MGAPPVEHIQWAQLVGATKVAGAWHQLMRLGHLGDLRLVTLVGEGGEEEQGQGWQAWRWDQDEHIMMRRRVD
jgi:hypothetical protein